MSKLAINREAKYYKHLTRLSGLILFIFAYAVVITGSTYAFKIISATSNVATGEGGCFQVNYSGQNLNAGDLLTTTNYLDGAHTTVTLSKDSTCKIYNEANIYLHTNDTTTAPIDSKPALRYKLLSGENEISEGIISSKGDYILATVPITDTATTYTVYLWIDSDLSEGAYHGTSFSGYIYAESAQTSTIENQYLVSFNTNGGEKIAPKTVTYGSTYGTLPTPTRNGYTFAGWNGKNLFNKNESPISSQTYVKGDGTEVSYHEYSTYKVYLKSNTTYTITNSGNSTAPGYAIFNSAGNRIAGENYNNRAQITFTTPSNTSYIKFSVVTEESESAAWRYDKDYFQLEEGNTATTYEPYILGASTTVTQEHNHTLHAVWTPKTYTVTFNANGGSVTPSTKQVTMGQSYGNLPTPTRSGYTFKGWNGKNLFNYDTSTVWAAATSKQLVRGEKAFVRNPTYSSNNIWPIFSDVTINYANSISYTMSFDIWADSNLSIDNRLYINDTTSTTHNLSSVETSKKRLIGSFVYNNPSSQRIVHIYPQSIPNNCNIYASNVQIEQGNTATDYEPYYVATSTTVTQAKNHTLTAIWEQN